MVFAIVVDGLLDTFPPGSCTRSSMGTNIFRWGYELITPCLLLVVKVGQVQAILLQMETHPNFTALWVFEKLQLTEPGQDFGDPHSGFSSSCSVLKACFPCSGVVQPQTCSRDSLLMGQKENTGGDRTAAYGSGSSASHGSPLFDPKTVYVLCRKQSLSKFPQYLTIIQ